MFDCRWQAAGFWDQKWVTKVEREDRPGWLSYWAKMCNSESVSASVMQGILYYYIILCIYI